MTYAWVSFCYLIVKFLRDFALGMLTLTELNWTSPRALVDGKSSQERLPYLLSSLARHQILSGFPLLAQYVLPWCLPCPLLFIIFLLFLLSSLMGPKAAWWSPGVSHCHWLECSEKWVRQRGSLLSASDFWLRLNLGYVTFRDAQEICFTSLLV